MKRTSLVLSSAALSVFLTACGGGGSSPSQQPSASFVEHVVAGAQAAAEGLPEVKPFAGGFVTVEGQSVGYVSGSSPKELAFKVGKEIVDNPVKYEPLYRILLSDKGLTVSIAGDRIATSAVTGAGIYGNPSVFVVKLTANGVVVTGG